MKATSVKRTEKLETDLQLQRHQVMARRVLSGELNDLENLPDDVLLLVAYGLHPFESRFLTIEQARRVRTWHGGLPHDVQQAWLTARSIDQLAAVALANRYPFPAGNSG